MKLTCGIFLINNKNKILIGHPTNHAKDLWSIPKGQPKKGESNILTAFRDFEEETSIDLWNMDKITEKIGSFVYPNKKKTLVAYQVSIKKTIPIKKIHCTSMVHPKVYGEEVPEMDMFKWVTKDEAMILLHPVQREALNLINLDI